MLVRDSNGQAGWNGDWGVTDSRWQLVDQTNIKGLGIGNFKKGVFWIPLQQFLRCVKSKLEFLSP